MSHDRKQRIEEALKNAFAPTQLLVRDDSHKHAGHAGWREGGGTHMHVQLVAGAFAGKSRVEAQRMVNAALQPFFAEGLHALSMEVRGE